MEAARTSWGKEPPCSHARLTSSAWPPQQPPQPPSRSPWPPPVWPPARRRPTAPAAGPAPRPPPPSPPWRRHRPAPRPASSVSRPAASSTPASPEGARPQRADVHRRRAVRQPGRQPRRVQHPLQRRRVQINLGAISYSRGKGWVKAWAAGTTEPLASLVNYDTTGPIANMVTIPVKLERPLRPADRLQGPPLRRHRRLLRQAALRRGPVPRLRLQRHLLRRGLDEPGRHGLLHGDLRPQRPHLRRGHQRHRLRDDPRRLRRRGLLQRDLNTVDREGHQRLQHARPTPTSPSASPAETASAQGGRCRGIRAPCRVPLRAAALGKSPTQSPHRRPPRPTLSAARSLSHRPSNEGAWNARTTTTCHEVLRRRSRCSRPCPHHRWRRSRRRRGVRRARQRSLAATSPPAAAPPPAPGSGLRLIGVAPGRIIATRVPGSAQRQRRTIAAFAPSPPRGSRGLRHPPRHPRALQINLGAPRTPAGRRAGSRAGPPGTTEPLASLVNYPTGPISNMVTIPVNASESTSTSGRSQGPDLRRHRRVLRQAALRLDQQDGTVYAASLRPGLRDADQCRAVPADLRPYVRAASPRRDFTWSPASTSPPTWAPRRREHRPRRDRRSGRPFADSYFPLSLTC